MTSFPLYTTLSQNLVAKDLTVLQKNDFVKKIATLEPEAHELIYALIKCYYIEKESGDSITIPYNGKLDKDCINFNLLSLPLQLRQMLYKFVNLHKQKVEMDNKMYANGA